MINVLIVEDENIVTELFAHYISNAGDRYRVVGHVRDAANAEVVCARSGVDLILMDICTAEGSSGIDYAGRIKKKYPGIKIIMITSAPEYSFLERSRRAGADSFWYKEAGERQLIDVMDRTVAGENVWPDSSPDIMLGLAKSSELTAKEKEVLFYIVMGYSIGEIAEKMFVDYTTTKTHIKHLREKTGARNNAELAVMASKTRFVLPDY